MQTIDMRHSILVCALIFMAFCPQAEAQSRPVSNAWTRVRTEHFTVIGNTDAERLRATAVRLEQFRSAIQKVLGIQQKDQVETRVVIFRDAASFRPFKPKRSNGTADDLVSGQFHSGGDLNHISAADDGKQISTVFHELVHDLLARNYTKTEVPAWLNEGLAEYFQGSRIDDEGFAEFGLPDRPHLSTLRRQPLIGWSEFFSTDDISLQQSPDNSRLVFYAQSWALVSELIRRISTESPQADGDTERRKINPGRLIQEAKTLPHSVLDPLVKNYVATVEQKPALLNVRVAPVTKSAVTSQLTDAETNAYLGDLAFRVRDLEAAESYLNAALQRSPDLSIANSSLALLRLSQRRFSDARLLFDRAMSTESDNFLVYYYSAYLISREHTNELGSISLIPTEQAAKMRMRLRRAIELNPLHSESLKLLGVVALVNGDAMEDALVAVRKAIELQPGNAEYKLIASQLLLRLERPSDAKIAAADVIASTPDTFFRREAEQVITSSEAFIKARSETGKLLLHVNDSRDTRPLILKYNDLTEEQIAAIDRNREINNLNRLIERPSSDERLEVGRIERIRCTERGTTYLFRSERGLLRLAGGGFEDLRVKVLLDGTHSFTFKCEASFSNILAAVIYRPAENTAGFDGRFISAAFVPDHFRLRSIEEISLERQVIIEGRRQSDLAANAKAAAEEQKELERQARETQLRNIEARLREPAAGESRLIAIPENLQCLNSRLVLQASSGGSKLVFSSPLAKRPEIRSYTPETGILEFSCRTQLPPVTAVITYRDDPTLPGRKELIAVEFVPVSLKLN